MAPTPKPKNPPKPLEMFLNANQDIARSMDTLVRATTDIRREESRNDSLRRVNFTELSPSPTLNRDNASQWNQPDFTTMNANTKESNKDLKPEAVARMNALVATAQKASGDVFNNNTADAIRSFLSNTPEGKALVAANAQRDLNNPGFLAEGTPEEREAAALGYATRRVESDIALSLTRQTEAAIATAEKKRVRSD
ncbi:MAG: hypothetical protein K2Q01_06815, partial [Rickettsiales bacterium]|nr:hypothetical protein [Rickettsiales bacterium]